MATEPEPLFKPTGDPIPLEELAEYTELGEVAITRGDVERAIATAEIELKKYLLSRQQKKK